MKVIDNILLFGTFPGRSRYLTGTIGVMRGLPHRRQGYRHNTISQKRTKRRLPLSQALVNYY